MHKWNFHCSVQVDFWCKYYTNSLQLTVVLNFLLSLVWRKCHTQVRGPYNWRLQLEYHQLTHKHTQTQSQIFITWWSFLRWLAFSVVSIPFSKGMYSLWWWIFIWSSKAPGGPDINRDPALINIEPKGIHSITESLETKKRPSQLTNIWLIVCISLWKQKGGGMLGWGSNCICVS